MAAVAVAGPSAAGRPGGNPTEEDSIIKARFLTQTSVSKGEPPLKKLTKRFIQFAEEAENGSVEAAEEACKSLLREVGLLEFTSRKLQVICDANHREQEAYAASRAQLEQLILQVQEGTERKKRKLASARVSRQHKEEYEVLRNLIMEHPTRSSTQAQIDQVKAEIEAVTSEGTKVAMLIAKRRKQLALLFHVIDELKDAVEEPEGVPQGGQGGGEVMEVD